MTLVLVLVVLAMREAARPGVYEIFFPDTSTYVAQTSSAVVQREKQQLITVSDGPDLSDDVAGAIVENDPVATFAAWLRGGDLDIELPAELDSDAASSEPEKAIAMQRQLISAAIDGTVWRAADGPGLFASLAMHDPRGPRFHAIQAMRSSALIAGVIPLLQQPDVYRGQSLAADGKIVSIEEIKAPENSFAVARYWNLWLLPDDASDRPWLVVVPELPVALRGLLDRPEAHSASDEELARREEAANKQVYSVAAPRPSVRVLGEFFKRLSYQSEAGAELTPVLVGHVESISPNGNPIVSASIQQANPKPNQPQEQKREVPILWILIGSSLMGLILALLVMWRTAVFHRHLRRRRASREVKLSFLFFFVAIPAASNAAAQSLTDLLPGFDVPRMQTLTQNAQPIMGNPRINIDELAKLVFRVNRLSDQVLGERVRQSASPPVVGDAVAIDAVIGQTHSLTVSTELQEYLELDRVEMIQLEPVDGIPHILFSTPLPDGAVAGDRVSGVAVRLRGPTSPAAASLEDDPPSETTKPLDSKSNQIIVDVSGRLRWMPSQPNSPAQQVLTIAGVDLSRLADLKKLDRQPMTESDSPIFYPLIGAARAVSVQADSGDSSRGEPFADAVATMRAHTKVVAPVDLLRNPNGFTGDWIRLDIESVRITRVAVTSAQRQREIGGEFYYEIDAIGDLGNVELRIDVPEGDPVVIDNRYPLTIVSPSLPEFLKPDGNGPPPLVFSQRTAIGVEGFFYRLWGYESDLMQQRDSKLFAPLVIAGVITDRTPPGSDPLGVHVIGRMAALGVIAAILAAIAYHLITRRGDREARRRRMRRNV